MVVRALVSNQRCSAGLGPISAEQANAQFNREEADTKSFHVNLRASENPERKSGLPTWPGASSCHLAWSPRWVRSQPGIRVSQQQRTRKKLFGNKPLKTALGCSECCSKEELVKSNLQLLCGKYLQVFASCDPGAFHRPRSGCGSSRDISCL